MQEQEKIQHVPVKIYRSQDRLMIATPLPGLQPEDIMIQVKDDGHLVIQGELKGLLKDIKELLVDEWSVGGYYRDIELSDKVDGAHANATYGNGVLVLVLPLDTTTTAADIMLMKTGTDHGERVGHAGHQHIES